MVYSCHVEPLRERRCAKIPSNPDQHQHHGYRLYICHGPRSTIRAVGLRCSAASVDQSHTGQFFRACARVSKVLLDRKPDKKTDPLFTVDMMRQITGQSIYLIVVIWRKQTYITPAP